MAGHKLPQPGAGFQMSHSLLNSAPYTICIPAPGAEFPGKRRETVLSPPDPARLGQRMPFHQETMLCGTK